LVLNKIDLVKKEELESITQKYQELYNFAQIIEVSALQGENTAGLVDKLVEYLPEGPRYYPEEMITDQPERFVVSELIREKILELTRDEVPHSVAVEVEEMKERGRKDLVYISATIYVERDSQKGIVLGKRGKMLKEIGIRARQDIERLLGSKIYLELWVKVKKDWRNKEQQLKYLGYRE
ncbi:MAG: GTPase Era, partial [Firmicutes bacterium HGW-Firmicutes-13]